MHPLKKAARIAGAIYLSMIVTGPSASFTFRANLSCAATPPRRPIISLLTRPCFVLRFSPISLGR